MQDEQTNKHTRSPKYLDQYVIGKKIEKMKNKDKQTCLPGHVIETDIETK